MYFYDKEKNIVITQKKSILENKKKKFYDSSVESEKIKQLIEIPESVQKFYSPKKSHVFEKNETTGKFRKRSGPAGPRSCRCPAPTPAGSRAPRRARRR